MKKFLAVLLSLVMVLSLFGPAAAALEEDIAPEEPAEAVVAAVEEEPAIPEDTEIIADEEPAAEEPAAEEAAEEPAEEADPVEAAAEEETEAEPAPAEKALPEEEEPAAEPEAEKLPVIATVFDKELDNVTVHAEAKAGAFSVPVELQVKPLAKSSAEYKEADEALAEEGYDYDGMLAFDIGFVDATGAPVEPAGDVAVSLKLKTGGIVPEDAEEALVAHITDDGVEPVADTADETPGVVTLEANALSADFVVSSFSTFVITWTSGEEKLEANIHWGIVNNGTFTEFDAADLDTTATNVSLRNSFSGYSYRSAEYCAPGVARGAGVSILSELYKTADGSWEYTQAAGEDTTATRKPIADGSNIYAYYYVPGSPNPSGAGSSDIPAPTTTKTVSKNTDGTYTITLDVEGKVVPEDNSHYANVLIILDATRSMSMNGSSKWDKAKLAVQTLIDTLTTGDNVGNKGKIDFCLVTFGRAATLNDWTKDETTLRSTVGDLNTVSTSGTNWEAGLRAGVAALGTDLENPKPDSDPLYVIFLTDGDPNVYYTDPQSTNYTDSGTTNGYGANSDTSAEHAEGEAQTLASAGALYGIYCFDGTTADTTSESYTRLDSVITGQGQGGQKTIAATADTIEDEFKAIAQTIIDELGASNLSVDDGVPSLSNVSAAVSGEASGFVYQKKGPTDEDYTAWAEAPGASYSSDNGVTWDLAELGTVQPGTSYRLQFTVWPSQAAYDKIADLNNGLITPVPSEADLAKEGIAKDENGEYYLLTNTHLKTSYTVNGTTYTDQPKELPQGAMALPTETISVKKIWNNFIDQQNPPAGVKLVLTKDGANYLYGDNAIEVSSTTNWEKADIYISYGQIRSTTSGYEILETGHDYEIVEPLNYDGDYRWELTSEVYHPMVINGTKTMLIKDETVTGTEGKDYYVINKVKYKVSDGTGNKLQAWNDRRSWLQLEKKVTGEGADPDALFEFTVTINDANKEDIWYSAWDPTLPGDEEGTLGNTVKDLETNGTAEAGNTGYFYKASGSAITVKVKAGWTVRFLNLPSGTTYTIEETTLPDGFAFEKAEDSQVVDTAAQQDAPQRPTIAADGKVEGTINVPNVEFYVDYTNKYEETSITVTKQWMDNNDQIGSRPTTAEYASDISLMVNGTASTAYDKNRTITKSESADNVYIITYTGLPMYINNTEATYTVAESTVPEGYAVTGSPASNNGVIVNTLATGDLTISKTVSSSIPGDLTKKFTFTITTDPSVNGTFTATGAVTSVKFTSGTATVELANNETVTITGLAAGVKYTVTETAVDGFTTTKTGDTGTISDTVSTAAFTNTRQTGSLAVTKTVTSSTAADKQKEFSFTVTLGDTTVSGTFGDMSFTNGVATFTLKDGETANATGLPAAVTYTVTEAAADGFVTTKTGDTGTISTTASTAAFTNTRSEGGLTITKTVSSPAESDKTVKFKFTITLSDTTLNETYSGVEFKAGVATVELTDGETKTIEGLPQGVTYTVTEEAVDNFTTTKTGDTGTISTTTSTAAFTNTRDVGSLKVTKAVTSSTAADKTTKFTFTITLDDTTVTGTFGDMSFTNGVATVQLADGESATATGLPQGVGYTVAETEVDGFVTSSTGATGTISATASEAVFTNERSEGSLTIKKTVSSPSAADKEVLFKFTITLDDTTINNTYSGVEFKNGVATVELADGDSKAIAGLPQGVGYTVTEEKVDNFTTTQTGDTGSISATAATAEFTNTRDVGELEVTKTVESSTTADKSVKFAFTVTLSDTTVSGKFDDMTFENGVAKFELADGESAKATGLPQGVTYTVAETAADGFTTTKTGDTGSITATAAKAAFTNTRSEGSLTIKKTVSSPAESDKSVKFKFTITLSDTTLNEIYSGVEFKAGVAEVELADGETKTIEGLPQGVTYTVTEEKVDNFTTTKSGDEGTISATAATAEFTNTRDVGSLEVSKTVVSSTTADKTVKFAFKVTLSDTTVNGTFGDITFKNGVAEFELADGESAKATGLPQGVSYTVEETAVDGFTTVKTGDTGNIAATAMAAVFTNTRSEGSLTIKKTVVSDLAEDKTAKFTFTITLSDTTINETYSGVKFEKGVATVELADGETKTIEGLPQGVTYTVTEDASDAYEVTKTGDTGTISDTASTAEFTNTRKMLEITITKVWEGDEDYDVRPDDVTVELYAGEEVAESDAIGEDEKWTVTYNVPEYTAEGDKIDYSADEKEIPVGYAKTVDGDAASGFTITNKFTPLFADPPVGKTVEGDPKVDETFTFKMTGSSTTDTVPMPDAAEGATEMEVDIEGTGEEEFGKFALVEPGTYTYVISEVIPETVEGYSEGYTYDDTVYTIVFEVTALGEENDNSLTMKITVNGEEVEELTAADVMFTNVFEEPTIDISGTKTWDDNDDQDGKRPESITINLLADGEKVDSVTVTEEDEWKFEFKGVPKYNDDLEEIEYTITEETVDGYETEITDFDVTNSHEPEKVDVSGEKAWDDNDDQDGKRPESLTVTLSNGDKVTLNEENEWKATITGLPKYEKGVEIEYTWTEASVDGYELTNTETEGYVTTLTNTHEPEVTKVEVTKVWTDADDKDEIRPDSVTIHLLADGTDTGASITLNEDNSWKGSFINLPKYKDGKEIAYTITEDAVEGYTTTISGSAADGFTVTNVHVPEDTPPTGDSNMLGLWIALLSVSALGIGAVLMPRKRRNGTG